MTPPEFRGLERAGDPAGRVGGARLELVRNGGETRLGMCYQQIPLRVMPPFNFDAEPAALLYLITLTTGLMDGDAQLIELTARPDTRAVVTGQSATRVHPALASFATQQWNVNVEDGACLVVLPGPTIPYRGSRYYQRGRVDLAPTSRLLWGDIWLPGRYDRGGELSERFVFDRIVQDFEVRKQGRLVYRDRFRWDGPWNPRQVEWHFGRHLATASLFVGGPTPMDLPAANSAVQRSCFPLEADVSCLRWCGPPAEVTADLTQVAFHIAAGWTSGNAARPWFSSNDLAPNHWFSTPRE